MSKSKLLSENIDHFKSDAYEFFSGDTDNFKYRVATNFDAYDLEGVKYYPKEFKKSLQSLIEANPYTQLTEVFGFENGLNIKEHLMGQDKSLTHLETISDAGSVKIGNGDFSILIPNGYGDGITNVFISEKEIHVPLKFITTVEGVIEVFDYDCRDNVIKTIKGKYAIFSGDGNVVFSRWE